MFFSLYFFYGHILGIVLFAFHNVNDLFISLRHALIADMRHIPDTFFRGLCAAP